MRGCRGCRGGRRRRRVGRHYRRRGGGGGIGAAVREVVSVAVAVVLFRGGRCMRMRAGRMQRWGRHGT